MFKDNFRESLVLVGLFVILLIVSESEPNYQSIKLQQDNIVHEVRHPVQGWRLSAINNNETCIRFVWSWIKCANRCSISSSCSGVNYASQRYLCCMLNEHPWLWLPTNDSNDYMWAKGLHFLPEEPVSYHMVSIGVSPFKSTPRLRVRSVRGGFI